MAKRIRGFLKELKRRKVYHVAVVYAAIAFLIWQVADIAFPAIGLPDSAITLVLALSALSFPIALVLAWAYEVTPESQARADSEDGAQAIKEDSPSRPQVQPAIHRSLAVLPFDNMSPEPVSESFSDGSTEPTCGTSVRSWNVAYLVEGSARRHSGRDRRACDTPDTGRNPRGLRDACSAPD